VRNRLSPTLIALFTVLVLALGLVAPAIAADPDEHGRWAPGTSAALSVYHGPVEVTLSDADSDGHRLGDLRVTSVPTTDADGETVGRLDATLTTVAIDTPAVGDELRTSVLVFTFDVADESQVVVQGSAHYPGQGATIATGDTTVRPIVGGSGRFAGVSGEAVTEHFEDGSWVHRLTFQRPRADRADRADRAFGRALRSHIREGVREWRDEHQEVSEERKEAQAERKAERREAQAERKEAQAERKADRDADAAAIDERYTDAAADETGVVRTDLGIAAPASAPGEDLGLWHYVIPARTDLAPHTHPGWQLARITAGELEYSVVSGLGELLRADGSSEPMGPGTYLLTTGDGVIENPDLVHFAANRTDDIVTIIAATLFPAGEPIATLVEEPAADEAVTDEEMAAASPAA
jgi:quercetin dioxygenase-like cupin family protein